jgi:hypothetical protein
MKYNELQVYFEKGKEGIIELMEKVSDVIEMIEDYQSQFKSNQLTEESDLKTALNVLTGLHSETTVIAGVAEAYSEVNEARELLVAKNSMVDDGKGGKKSPTDEIAKAMSKVNNLDFVRTTNLFKAYSKVCAQKIMTCQSQLNYLKGQKYIPQEEK